MPSQHNVYSLVGRPVGVSLTNGQGVSGVLCSVQGGQIYLLEFLYRDQFATKHYPFRQIRAIHPFPPCYNPPPDRYRGS